MMELYLKCFMFLVLIFGRVTSLSLQEIDAEWFSFKMKFNRTYERKTEEYYRYSVFTEHLKSIYLHNMAADRGRYTYWLGVNKFADLTSKEFNEMYANLKLSTNIPKRRTYARHHQVKQCNSQSLPSEIDWRSENCVTNVKDQGTCSSCYAFAATGALEGQKCLTYNELVSLSEQNIVDCSNDPEYDNHGCKNGSVDSAYLYVLYNGVDTEESYPYRGVIGTCHQQQGVKGVQEIYDYVDVHYGSVCELQRAVAEIGPISVCIDTKGEGDKFQLYQHGVYDNSECRSCPAFLNHAVLVVGYGNTAEGQGYWLIKNSYGTSWGIGGYMKMVRNGKNTCGIATRASYPIV